jgi:hypothetical protein
METKEEYGREKILERLLEIEEKPVYHKDMAYHVAGFMSREFVAWRTPLFDSDRSRGLRFQNL